MKDRIFDICNNLSASGIKPTLERVRSELGAGSFSTINTMLKEWKDSRLDKQAVTAVDLPSDIVDIGQKAAAMIWAIADQHCSKVISGIKHDALVVSEQITLERGEALGEINRLEIESERLALNLGQQAELIQQLRIQIGTSAGMLESIKSENSALILKLEASQKVASQLEGMLKVYESLGGTSLESNAVENKKPRTKVKKDVNS